MIIEVLGPSGSGKTTILNNLRGICDSTITFRDEKRNFKDIKIQPKSIYSGTIDFCHSLVSRCDFSKDSQKKALDILEKSIKEDILYRSTHPSQCLVHDELILHRAFSFLPRSTDFIQDSHIFFNTVPLPKAAIIVASNISENLKRLKGRGLTNVTKGLSEEELKKVVIKAHLICKIANYVLKNRGLNILCVDSTKNIERNSFIIKKFIDGVKLENNF